MVDFETAENGTIPEHVPHERVTEFDIYAPPRGCIDAFAPWLELKRTSPFQLIWTVKNGGHWIVLDGRQMPELLADSGRLSSQVFTAPRALAEAVNLIPLQVDPPVHQLYRSVLSKEMGAKHLFALDAPLRDIAKTLIGGFRERGGCEFITEFSEVFPIHVYLLLIDLPREDAQMLRRLASQLSRPDGTMTAEQLVSAIDAYLAPYVVSRLSNPRSDLLSRVLSHRMDGRPWTLDEATRVSRNLLVGGLDTVAAVMGFVALFLAQNPEHQCKIRNDPDIIPAAADEFLRRFPVVVLGREARHDFELDGVMVKARDLIMFPTMLHNLDPSISDHPQNVDFSRGLAKHSTLGHGIHRCVGAGLARSELIAFLEIWHDVIPPYSIDPDDEVLQKAGTVGTVSRLPLIWRA